MKRTCFLWSAVLLGLAVPSSVGLNPDGSAAYAAGSETEKETDGNMSEAESEEAEESFDSDKTETGQDTEYNRKDADSAVCAYIAAAKQADLEVLLQCFAIEEFIENYQSDSRDAEYIQKPVLEERELEAAAQIMGFYTGLHMPADFFEHPEEFMEWMSTVSIEELLDPEKYETLEILRIDLPESDAQVHRDRIGNESLHMRVYGAEGWDYRSALLAMGDQTYYCGFRFDVYDDEYKIDLLVCPTTLIGQDMNVFPCTEEEYLSIIAE